MKSTHAVILLLLTQIGLAPSHVGFAGESVTEAIYAVELMLHENRLDGCTDCGCRLNGTVQKGENQSWWMTFAQVKPGRKSGSWERLGPDALSYCGEGNFAQVRKEFVAGNGSPYLVVQLDLDTGRKSRATDDIEFNLHSSSFAGFRNNSRARYRQDEISGSGAATRGLQAAIPVLMMDADEQDAFGVKDIIVSLNVTPLGKGASGFGRVEVSSDFPGAWILLDGTRVGRVVEGAPFLLQPVTSGTHTVSVRDFSGRRVDESIELDAGDTLKLRLDVFNPDFENEARPIHGVGANPEGFNEYWRKRDGALMVHIPAGEFFMGSDEPASGDDSKPLHVVHLDDFLIDKTEVSWRQFRKFADATGATLPPEPLWGRGDDYPLSSTTWNEASEYCAWVGGRLPTEAEWEKAARGTDRRDYPWGDVWDSTRCNSISGGLHQPEPVGTFAACSSPFGVLDMIGSHWQWVSDFYAADYYEKSPPSNPRGPDHGSQRVKRGGYWMSHPQQLQVTRRGKSAADWRNSTHGFRCAMTPAGEP